MFHVGQKVVCVTTDHSLDPESNNDDVPLSHWLTVGNVYVIRKVSNRKHALVWLQGINRYQFRRGRNWSDSGFLAVRFRSLDERKTDISFAHEILRRVTKRTRVEA